MRQSASPQEIRLSCRTGTNLPLKRGFFANVGPKTLTVCDDIQPKPECPFGAFAHTSTILAPLRGQLQASRCPLSGDISRHPKPDMRGAKGEILRLSRSGTKPGTITVGTEI